MAFSFVAANAMWYQPGAHPSPLLRTRLPFTHPQTANLEEEPGGASPRKVTTFVIQREDEAAAAKSEQPKPEPEAEVAQIQPAATPVTGSTLITSIQKELTRRGLYDGPADGKTGPKTAAAILRFEKQAGRPETGDRKRNTARSPAERAWLRKGHGPPPDLPNGPMRTSRAARASSTRLPPRSAMPRSIHRFIPKVDIPASSELVMNIQKGLSNLAYTDVSIDGVAGEQTRSAIRHFEKHYRLPRNRRARATSAEENEGNRCALKVPIPRTKVGQHFPFVNPVSINFCR